MRTSRIALSVLLLSGAVAGAQQATTASFASDALRPPRFPTPRTAVPLDPADSLYRLARTALADGDFKRAAQLFQSVADRFADSEFAPDALYYRAYALFKSGTSNELRLAITALDRQASRYPNAGTLNDAKQLRASILSEQARRGEAEAGREIALGATTLGTDTRCPTDDDAAKLIALNALVQQDPDAVLPVLTKLLERRDNCSVSLRKRAVFMIAQTREEERADILLRVASADPSNEVRREAIQWLSEVATERAARALDSILFSAADAELRDRALSALSRHRSPAARASIRRYAELPSVSTDLRVRAVNYISNGRKAGDEVDFFKALFAKTASPELREALVQAVANQRTGDRTPWLMSVVRDRRQETEVRKRALYYVGHATMSIQSGQSAQGGTPAPGAQGMNVFSTNTLAYAVDLRELVALYDEFNGQPEMQDQLLWVYQQRRETEATDKLLQIAKTEKNPELRRKAIAALGQRKDPRVKQFMIDLLSP